MPSDPQPDGSYRGLPATRDDVEKDAPYEVRREATPCPQAFGNIASKPSAAVQQCTSVSVQVVFKVPRLEAHVEDGQDHYTIVLPKYVAEEMRTQAAEQDLDGEESRTCTCGLH